MTRFLLSLEEAVQFVCKVLNVMKGGEIFVKKIPSMNVLDIAKSIDPNKKIKIVGDRIGEKIHEQMITMEDSRRTIEYGDYYVIYSTNDFKRNKNGKKVKKNFYYDSVSNKKWMSMANLANWIKKNKSSFE